VRVNEGIIDFELGFAQLQGREVVSILTSLRNAATYNKHELAAPRVILWPDQERLWIQCIEPLRGTYPALWSLGDYSPDQATGPAVWLRYQLETQGGEEVPVIYTVNG